MQEASPVSIGIVVDLTKQTVHGFGPDDINVRVSEVTETLIKFGGTQEGLFGKGTWQTMGDIDRVTGAAWASVNIFHDNTVIELSYYELKCKPTNQTIYKIRGG
jgi:hypothetical protein